MKKRPKRLTQSLLYADRKKRYMLALPIKNYGNTTLPWGYTVKEGCPGEIEPVDEHFKLLVSAKRFLRNSSYKEVSAWLTHKTESYISAEGLRKLMNNRPPHDVCAQPIEIRLATFEELFNREI